MNPLLHTACRLQITTFVNDYTGADISKVCSEELLESHLIPQLITSKSKSKGNQNHDEQQPPKVSNYGLSACMWQHGRLILLDTHTQADPPQGQFKVVAKYDYSPRTMEDLSLTKGEVLTVFDDSKDWWFARNQQG